VVRQAFPADGSGPRTNFFVASYSCGARTLLSSDVSSYLVNQQWFRHEGLPLCRCAALAFRSLSLCFFFSFPLSLSLSFSLLPSSRSCNFSLYVARYVRTDAARRAKNGFAAAWWPYRSRYRFIRADIDVNAVFHRMLLSLDAIERNVRDVGNVGYFPSSKGRLIFSSFFLYSPFEEETECSFSVFCWNHIVFFFRGNYVNFLLQRSFRSSLTRFWEITAKEMKRATATRLLLF